MFGTVHVCGTAEIGRAQRSAIKLRKNGTHCVACDFSQLATGLAAVYMKGRAASRSVCCADLDLSLAPTRIAKEASFTVAMLG